MNTLPWSAAMVSNAGDFATAAIRNYWEQRMVRDAVAQAHQRKPIHTAYEIGAGYGRMTRVLAETARKVVAFERDPELLAKGQRLNPDLSFVAIQDLGRIPTEDGSAEFAMTFTVLQHLTDATCQAAVTELKRLVCVGHLLLVEDTDATQPDRDLPHDETAMCRHRSVARYQAMLAPWKLVTVWPRQIEPTAPMRTVGEAMLFAR